MRRRIWYGSGERAGSLNISNLMSMATDQGVLIRGDYRRNIEAWESVIPSERIHFIFFDDIQVDGRKELECLCEFLEVNPNLLPEYPVTARPVNFAPESTMPVAIRRELIEYYKKDQKFLEQKFSRDLTSWYAG